MLSSADCCPDGGGGANLKLIDITQPGSFESPGGQDGYLLAALRDVLWCAVTFTQVIYAT